MKISLILISLLISIQSVSVQASDIIDVKQLSPALNWKQARTECTNLGDTWDLPTVEQALSDEFESKLVNPLKVRDLKSQRIKTYFLVWVKSDQEELNQQLVEVSQALKIDYETATVDEVVEMIEFAIEQHPSLLKVIPSEVLDEQTQLDRERMWKY